MTTPGRPTLTACFVFLTGWCCLSLAAAGQTAPPGRPATLQPPATTPPVAKVPEPRPVPVPADPLEASRAPYLRKITAIRAARDTRAATITKSYLATLERLQRDATARGDLD